MNNSIKLKGWLIILAQSLCINYFIINLTFAQIISRGSQNSEVNKDLILTTHSFLLYPANVRSAAMGNINNGSPSIFSSTNNPSLIPYVPNTPWGITMNYQPLSLSKAINDVYMLNSGGFYKFNYNDAITTSLRYFTFGKVPLTNIDYDNFGIALPYNLVLNLGYTRRFNKSFSLAFNGRFIGSQITSNAAFSGSVDVIFAKAISTDIYFTYRQSFYKHNHPRSHLQSNLSLKNLGVFFGYRYDYGFRPYLPALLNLGFNYEWLLSSEQKLSANLEFNKLLVPTYKKGDNQNIIRNYQYISVFNSWFRSFYDASDGIYGELAKIYYTFSLEDWIYQKLALRIGYLHQNYISGNKKLITFGLGIKITDDIELGMAYGYNIAQLKEFNSPLRNQLFFGLAYQFYKVGYNENNFSKWRTNKRKNPFYY